MTIMKLLIFVFLFVSCEHYSEYNEDELRGYLAPIGNHIISVSNIDHPYFANAISIGTHIEFQLPLLQHETIIRLQQKKVDSWLIRISKESGIQRNILATTEILEKLI